MLLSFLYSSREQGRLGCLRLGRASFILPLSASVLSSTEGARHQGTLWNHSCFSTYIHPAKSFSQLSFQLQTTACPQTAQSRRWWKHLGVLITLLFVTHLPTTVDLRDFKLLLSCALLPLSPRDKILTGGLLLWSALRFPVFSLVSSCSPVRAYPSHWGPDVSVEQMQLLQRKMSP